MKRLVAPLLAILTACLSATAADLDVVDVSHIGVYITPYYDSEGPVINIGAYSSGLASTNETKFLTTIARMKEHWDQLSFPEVYVGAIRLYDLGYRRESIYWFYSAQYRLRQLTALMDETKSGTLGDDGFELTHAGSAFHTLIGPYINGYAFGDADSLVKIIVKVQEEARVIPDLKAIYPGVAFKKQSGWNAANTELANSMDKLISTIKEKKDELKRQRIEQGVDAKFSKLTTKDLPDRPAR